VLDWANVDQDREWEDDLLIKRPVVVRTVSDFLLYAAKVKARWFDDKDPWGPWFRGHQRAHWPLAPRLYREYGGYAAIKTDRIEDEIREEFIVRAPILSESMPVNRSDWDWYFMMQHFGTPTRLLDWTEGSLIGLYFAVKDNPGLYDAAVWILDPYGLNQKAIGREEVFPPSAMLIPQHEKLVKPWLPEIFKPRTRLPKGPLAVYPTHIARRISTQRSAFTIHGSDERGLDRLAGDQDYMEKIIIPAISVRHIMRELEACGIDEVTIFPDLDGLSRTICSRWSPGQSKSPHRGAYTRLRASKIHGVGVFAIRKIRKGVPIFEGENPEMLWIRKSSLPRTPSEVRRLYDDFAVLEGDHYGCPENFNRLSLSWYINEPRKGEAPNVYCKPDAYEFFALRDIQAGEELTVVYRTYSDLPPDAALHSKVK
jgi:hypothetical protein